MTPKTKRYLTIWISALLLLLPVGCSDDASSSGDQPADTLNTNPDGDQDSASNTSQNDISTAPDTESTSTDTQTTADTSGGTDTLNSDTKEPSDTSTDTVDDGSNNECTSGLLCGQPVQCCPVDSECIQGQCLNTCDSGVRCGPNRELCCDAGNVCVAGTCAAPSGACLDSYDCEPGQFCEPTLGQCLPQPAGVTCQVIPVFSDIAADVEWEFADHDIISIPLVADITGDAGSEVVVNATQSSDWPRGEVVVLDGQTGAVKWRNGDTSTLATKRGAHGRSTLALGDVSGDGRPDIIYAARPATTAGNGGPTPVCAMDGEGLELWCSHTAGNTPAAVNFDIENGAITTANFDEDPQSEVVVGAALIDHDGTVLWNEGRGRVWVWDKRFV